MTTEAEVRATKNWLKIKTLENADEMMETRAVLAWSAAHRAWMNARNAACAAARAEAKADLDNNAALDEQATNAREIANTNLEESESAWTRAVRVEFSAARAEVQLLQAREAAQRAESEAAP